jgi:hypothetical protein
MKSVWLSALENTEQEAKTILQKLKTYGLAFSGHQWRDDNQKMAWAGPLEELSGPQCALWVVMGTAPSFLKHETRYGLSLLALCIQARRGAGYPMVILQTDAEALSAEDLPTPLQRADVLPAGLAGTPAKLVAKVHAKAVDPMSEYYIDMVGNQQFGQWFEVRPARGEWPGMIFGVDEGQITFQAVGPSGQLPTNSTLHYPMQGLRIEFGDRTYSAWAVRNRISTEHSYYVKVEGFPKSIVFGAFSENDETEMHHIELK